MFHSGERRRGMSLRELTEVVCFQGERSGSLEFIRNDSVLIDFKKKLGDDMLEAMPDVTADTSFDQGIMLPFR